MPRYTPRRNNLDDSLARIRRLSGYTGYGADGHGRMADDYHEVSCHVCDGRGSYSGRRGRVSCDRCSGKGVIRERLR